MRLLDGAGMLSFALFNMRSGVSFHDASFRAFLKRPIRDRCRGIPRLASKPYRREQVQDLLQKTLGRSQETLSRVLEQGSSGDSSQNVRLMAQDIISQTAQSLATSSPSLQERSSPSLQQRTFASDKHQQPARKYLPKYKENPAVTTTALAHLLWKRALRPGLDTAIDATCGQGYDSEALAKILFPGSESTVGPSHSSSRLICIDVQREACLATAERLSTYVAKNRVEVLQRSHAPLFPDSSIVPESIGAVVYNLGFLPRSDKKALTATSSTLESLQDAASFARPDGGIISVMTYPRTNKDEHESVLSFLEGIALFSSKTTDRRECAPSSPLVMKALESVWQRNGPHQKWRVQKVEKMGWVDAPVLITATRIR